MRTQIVLLTALIIISSLLLPWWIIAVISFIFLAYTDQKSLFQALMISFISGLISYLLYSLFSSVGLQKSPSELMANLLGELPSWSSFFITSIVGGLTSAFGGITGYIARKALK